MLRITPVKFNFLESHPSGFWKPPGYWDRGV